MPVVEVIVPINVLSNYKTTLIVYSKADDAIIRRSIPNNQIVSNNWIVLFKHHIVVVCIKKVPRSSPCHFDFHRLRASFAAHFGDLSVNIVN